MGVYTFFNDGWSLLGREGVVILVTNGRVFCFVFFFKYKSEVIPCSGTESQCYSEGADGLKND